jgi:plasmid stability protein
MSWNANASLPMTFENPATELRPYFVDMCYTCFYAEDMSKMIQLRHVPDALHRQLKARAALAGLPLSDFLIREVRKIAEQPTSQEFRQRLQLRAKYTGQVSPTEVLRSERDNR